jgi:hypothetical protein
MAEQGPVPALCLGRRQSYYHIAWGGQGHLERYQDLMPEYDAILAGDETTAMDLLSADIAFQQQDLTSRIVELTAAMDEASNQIEDLFPLVSLDR